MFFRLSVALWFGVSSVVGAVELSNCQILRDQIETALIADPNNIKLQSLLLAMSACQERAESEDAFVPSAADRSSVRLQALVGWEDNPSYLSAANNLYLQTDQGVVTLPLNTQSRRVSATRQLFGQYQRYGASSNLKAYAQIKDYAESIFPQQHWLGVEYQNKQWISPFEVVLGLSKSDLGWASVQQGKMATKWLVGERFSLMPEVKWRRYEQDSELDGRFYGVTLGWQAEREPLAVQLTLGQDHPTGDRAGGVFHTQELKVFWLSVFGQNQLIANLYARRQQDESGYSVLIGDNRRRDMWLTGGLLQWRWAAIDKLTPVFELDVSQQQANIALFDWQNKAIRVGVEFLW